ncbi:MAG: hypothetical protein WC655_29275 [Candidatus Hydrogenedentales bacterium]
MHARSSSVALLAHRASRYWHIGRFATGTSGVSLLAHRALRYWLIERCATRSSGVALLDHVPFASARGRE